MGIPFNHYWRMNCNGCWKGYNAPWRWLGRLLVRRHEFFCMEEAMVLVKSIQEKEEIAAKRGRAVHDWLMWIWPESYTARQRRWARRYCEARGYDWSLVGAAHFQQIAELKAKGEAWF